MHDSNFWTKGIFLVIGIACLGFGVKNYFDEKALIATYEPATATLENWNLDISTKYKSQQYYCPVYTYTTKGEQTRSYSTRGCITNPDFGAIGTKQEQIYYNPENPEAFEIRAGWNGDEYFGLIMGIIGFAFIGLILLIWGVAEKIGARVGNKNRYLHKQ
jgi:hypothetical protein